MPLQTLLPVAASLRLPIFLLRSPCLHCARAFWTPVSGWTQTTAVDAVFARPNTAQANQIRQFLALYGVHMRQYKLGGEVVHGLSTRVCEELALNEGAER